MNLNLRNFIKGLYSNFNDLFIENLKQNSLNESKVSYKFIKSLCPHILQFIYKITIYIS